MSASSVSVSPAASDSTRPVVGASAYRPDIDGLRAIAALAVVGVHAGLLPGGGAGVDVFFVISGFLISGIILRALKRGTFSCLDFYTSRVKRIFPALLAVMVPVWVVGRFVLRPDEYRELGNQIAAGAGFVQNLYVYQSWPRPKTTEHFLSHLWTLGIEEQFYLFWPLVLWATWRLGTNLLISIAVITAASVTSYVWTSFREPIAILLPWNRLWELSIGAALAYVHVSGLADLTRMHAPPVVKALLWPQAPIRHLHGIAGASLLAVSFSGVLSVIGSLILVPCIACTGALLILSAGPQSWVNRYVLATRPMVLVGLLSYPLYLWHVPTFMIGAILQGRSEFAQYMQMSLSMKVGATSSAFLLAYLTYRYIESPIRSSPHTARIACVLCAAMAVSGAVAYFTTHRP